MWFFQSTQFCRDQWRNYGTIIGHLVLPPTDRQIATKRLTIIQVRTNDRGFEIKVLLHGVATTSGLFDSTRGRCPRGSSRIEPRAKSKYTRKFLKKFPPRMPLCVKPAVSFTGSMSSTAAFNFSSFESPRLNFGNCSNLTSSVTPAAPYTRIFDGCSKSSNCSCWESFSETTVMLAAVSIMKFSVLSKPSSSTSPLKKPLEVVRNGTSIVGSPGATAASA